jgi:hypothetical protein
MNYILRQDAEKILDIMNKFPDHDAFLLDIDTSSGIGSAITLTMDIIHNSVPGKFTVTVTGPKSW